MKTRVALALSAGILSFGFSAAGSASSLEEELAGLLQDHPNIRAAYKTVESSRQGVKHAKSSYYPQVSVSADVAHEVINSPAERNQGDGQQGKPSSRTPQSATVSVTQNLFDGFATASAVRTAKLNKELALMTLEGTRQNTVLEGVGTYVNVLRQKRLIELSRENEATIQQQLSLEDERVQRGSGIAVDVLQAKSRLQASKERRVTFEGALQDAVSRYAQTFNHPPDIDAMTDPVPPVEMVPSDLERAIDIALTGNPALGNSSVTIEVARERKRTVRAELYPSVDVSSSWNFEKNAGAVLGVRRDYSMTLTATWDLFTGFSTRNLLSQASFDLGASKDTYDYTARKVIEQTRLAWQALLTARQRLELLENAVNIASEVFSSRQKLREAGKETVINVLDAENEVNNTQINFTSASYDERLAVYQLLLAMGLLNPEGLNLY
ncbi:MAG: TolC family outer membrane protein [Rhodospirillales bacterium]|nr:TolC family outer membrane protein [Alphaproteobacteria bacterium]MBL6947308.1 TolC family outer membrane protein [Rhodospirillales bacterium]